MEENLLFALDIGTRSVVGLIGEQTGNSVKIIASDRQEHNTRAMLDGQIHDVPEVVRVLESVKARLEEKVGPLKKVSIAAAGRALCTIRTSSETDCSGRGALTAEDERALELSAVQAAQQQLATSNAVADPTAYYCVGYSVIRFSLDGTPLQSLIGQRGKLASIEIIATFLPRQVVDSLQSAVQAVGLEIATLTLEPIAAINVLIPATMRHLNLTLVDVGAGTSDVALTREGSVIGYGMVPFAGDEVTEAISQNYLLDFKVAEMLKRQLGNQEAQVNFTDVLGASHTIPAQEVIDSAAPTVTALAEAIAAQILALNNSAPQAVLLVGGGSLTPLLPEFLAKALNIAPSRIAIRRPEAIDGLESIPDELRAPDGVTPLGILKLAGGRTLNFINISVNGQSLRLFNLGKLTVADALLVAGVDIRSLHGRPGLGITVTINGQKQHLPGSMGEPGAITVNGAKASFTDSLREGDEIVVTKGNSGETPAPPLGQLIDLPPAISVILDDQFLNLGPLCTINGLPAEPATELGDRDHVICKQPATLAEVLALAGRSTEPVQNTYIINDSERTYRQWPSYTVNGDPATLSAPISDNAIIVSLPVPQPTIADLMGLDGTAEESYTIFFNEGKCHVPIRRYSFTVNGAPAQPSDTPAPGSSLNYSCYDIQPMVSDVLLAANFDPRSLPGAGRVTVLVNGQAAEYTTPVKNRDKVEITTA